MGKVNIDKYFKERLSSYSEDIDTDAIWNDLDLSEENNNRGVIFWLFGLMGTLAVIVLLYFGNFVSTQETIEPTLNQMHVDHQMMDKNEENFTAFQATTEIVHTNEKVSALEKVNANKKIVNKKAKWNEDSKSPVAIDIPTSSNQNDLGQILVSNESNQTIKTNAGPTTSIQTPIETTQSNSRSNQKLSISKTTNEIRRQNLFLNNLAAIDKLDLKYLEYASHSAKYKDGLASVLVVPVVRKNAKKIEIDLYSNYNIVQRRLTTDSPGSFNEFIQNKKESETVLDGIALGTSVRFNLRSGLYAKLGLEAMSITERFNHNREEIETVLIADNITGTQPVTSRWINYNHHRLLSLPVSIGFEQNLARWSYFVEGGFHFNFLYQFSGLQLDGEGNVAEGALSLSDTRLRHSYVVSAGVKYQLTPRSSLYLQPRFQSTFSMDGPLAGDFSPPISHNFNLYGVQVGLR